MIAEDGDEDDDDELNLTDERVEVVVGDVS